MKLTNQPIRSFFIHTNVTKKKSERDAQAHMLIEAFLVIILYQKQKNDN